MGDKSLTQGMIFYGFWQDVTVTLFKTKSGLKSQAMSSLNDLEFAYAPVRDQVRDLREYL
jgi:hypothetical protein